MPKSGARWALLVRVVECRRDPGLRPVFDREVLAKLTEQKPLLILHLSDVRSTVKNRDRPKIALRFGVATCAYTAVVLDSP